MKLFAESPLHELSPAERRALRERRPAAAAEVSGTVAEILERVRGDGDRALFRLARELDGVVLDSLEVPLARCRESADRLSADVREAMERAIRNLETFHRAQLERLAPLAVEVEPGVRLERRAVPLHAAGIYAPGGRAAYPSSVLMGVVPAVVAGVDHVLVCSPPGPDGLPSAEVMAAAALAGATRVFAIGGAGAVAAMAFGTRTVPAAQVVVGPGNQWVAEAKRQVAGQVRIDSPAGPSELLVVGDAAADPAIVALELVAQAEHDPAAVVGLVTDSSALLAATREALEDALARTPRVDVARAALERRGFLLLVGSLDEALQFADEFAAEHLSLLTADPALHAGRVRTAGTVFLGPASSVAFGDYMTGANHVLPTGGASRAFSALSVESFVRTFTLQDVTGPAAASLATPVATLASAEGLPGHAAAARARAAS